MLGLWIVCAPAISAGKNIEVDSGRLFAGSSELA
jgi:hypothetical protein